MSNSLLRLCFIAFVIGCYLSCGFSVDKDKPAADAAEINTLLTNHCARCHALPSPMDLDKNTWSTYILPRMGYFLGIYPSDTTRSVLLETPALETVFPLNPQLTAAEWKKITNHFLTLAPDSLQRQNSPSSMVQKLFKPHFSPIFSSPPGTIDLHFSKFGGYYTVHRQVLCIKDR